MGEGTDIEDDVRIEPPVLLGAGCLVERGSQLIGPLIVGDGCVIESGAVLDGVIHWDGVKAGRGSLLEGSILGRNVIVHHEAVVRDDVVLGDRSRGPGGRRGAVGSAVRAALAHHGRRRPARRRTLLIRGARGGRSRPARRRRRPLLPEALRGLWRRRRLAVRRTAGRRSSRCLRRAALAAGPRWAGRRRAARAGAASVADASSPSRARRAAFVYEGSARALVTACKFRALRSIAGEMAELAAPAFAAAVEGTQADCVACVPGHRGRSLERGFNQAELLSRALAASVGLRHEPLLVRVREGARQSGMDRAARAANVRGLYALNTGADRVLDGIERVVIVDDVYTTGETLNHCAGVLADRGVETRVFTFARAVRRSRPRLRTPSPSAGMPAEASQPQP